MVQWQHLRLSLLRPGFDSRYPRYKRDYGVVVTLKLWELRPRVRFPVVPFYFRVNNSNQSAIAELGERSTKVRKVVGSSPTRGIGNILPSIQGAQLSGRAIDCRSIGHWFKSGRALFTILLSSYSSYSSVGRAHAQ